MSYSDILNTTQLYGNLLKSSFANTANNLQNVKFNAGPVNPNSSAAFTPKTARDIYNYSTEVEDPLSLYSDYNPWSTENLVLQGTQGLTYGKMGESLSPYLKQGFDVFGKNYTITNAAGDISKKWVPAGEEATFLSDASKAGDTVAAGGSVDLGPASTVYGLTRDQDPYSYSQTEALGSTAANMMAAHQIGAYVAPTAYASGAIGGAQATGLGTVNPYVMLAAIAFSWWQNKKRKKKAKRAKKKAIGEYQDALAEGYTSREDQVREMREDMLSKQTARDYERRAGRYDNQYGGSYDTYQGKEGMKFSPKELKKIAKAGRYGDTQLAHINPQEAQMLRAMGGSGTINPYTGLPEYNLFRNLVTGFGDVVHDVLTPVNDVVFPFLNAIGDMFGGGGGGGGGRVEQPPQEDIRRGEVSKKEKIIPSGIEIKGPNIQSHLKKSKDKEKLIEGDWVGDKPNPFTTPNVEEELDYANKGMKYQYAEGGNTDIIAEFTGNELVVNDQDALEKDLANGNAARVATRIKKAMKGGKITPGPETHNGNPMPVDSKGNIYAGGGTLPFKVKKGAGIYDHATDQFKSTMTDKEIAMVVQDNINKWKSNGMA